MSVGTPKLRDYGTPGVPESRKFGRGLSAADGREDRDLVAVVEVGEVAGDGFVAVHPDTRAVEDGGELRAVRRAQVLEQRAERRGLALVGAAARGLARLREQPDADGQRASRVTFVRAVGNASSRSGSIGSPVTSSMP